MVMKQRAKRSLEAVTSDYQGGPDSEKRNTLAFLAAQCIGRPNHILMIGSWGSSKELPD